MTKILAIGDVVGQNGMQMIEKHLHALILEKKIDFTIVNGENTAMRGTRGEHLSRLHRAGADVITLGNHTWGQYQFINEIDDFENVLRPYNFVEGLPGRGTLIAETPKGIRIGVANLIGRGNLDFHAENPFLCADRILRDWEGKCDISVIDFHAEMSSEKGALGWYLDGRVSAVFGTHTHVPTADLKILPKGTGYITDLGMTGAADSVLGIEPEQSVNLFLGGLPTRFREAGGLKGQMTGAIFHFDETTGHCIDTERVEILS